jgi:Flp pilus assembly pilin Flp
MLTATDVLTRPDTASTLSSDQVLISCAVRNEAASRTAATSRIFDERNHPPMFSNLLLLWTDDLGQDIAEYAVMLAVILVIVVGTLRLIGSNSNNAFSSVASSLQ